MTITSMKDFLGADDLVVVAPSPNHRVQFPNDGLLWGRLEFLQEVIGFLDVRFDGFFAWLVDGFVSERLTFGVFSRVSFSHRELSYRVA